MNKGIMERAIELAQSGEMSNVQAIQNRLSEEGYTFVHGHLNGLATRRQLRGMIAKAREVENL